MGVGLRWLSLIRNTQQSTESWRPQSGIEGLIKRRRGRGGECGGGLVVEFVTKKQNTEQPTQNRQQQLRWKMVLRGDVNRGELGGGWGVNRNTPIRVWAGTKNSCPIDFYCTNSTGVPWITKTTPPTNIINMVCRLPPLRHWFNKLSQSNAWAAIQIVLFDKITAWLIYFYSYLCFWQIACPQSKWWPKRHPSSTVSAQRIQID